MGCRANGQRVAQERQLAALQSARHFVASSINGGGSDVDVLSNQRSILDAEVGLDAFAADSGRVGLLVLQGLGEGWFVKSCPENHSPKPSLRNRNRDGVFVAQ